MIHNYFLMVTCWLGIIVTMQGTAPRPYTPMPPSIGVCASADRMADAGNAGFEFIIPSVAAYLKPTLSDSEFSFDEGKGSMPILACNSFFPAQMKCVGPEANVDSLLAYARTVFSRAERRKVSLIVFGSGAARKIPEGYDKALATGEFVGLCIKLAELAAVYDVKIALENLNKEETNLVNTVDEARVICEKVNMPNFGINADIYHMLKEHEPAHHLSAASKHIFNCEIAEPQNRTPPGVEGTDFSIYLRMLKEINYKGGLAVEARWSDFPNQAPAAYQTLKSQLDAVYQ
ncbi:sugar phosphate isomerase/epimerase family protein [Parapedobacter deserti]|uniref:Sugar phosphate isomerase/epimerase family protein n=1 Tax=Parapedobacter deserti TaxID=1912957 RepID=A0ABV7JEH8_9SPHI